METGLPSIDDLQEATTLTGAGEEFDLERWEILGDAFLKLSVSIALFLNRFVSIDHIVLFYSVTLHAEKNSFTTKLVKYLGNIC